jgi:phosphoglucosamine mutase
MSSERLFGTDGVRGSANDDLTPELALRLARAAGEGSEGGTAVVGRDTRRSGPMLAAAVHAGFNAAGLDTIDVGVIPVGGVSHLTRESGASFGVMVSASHNPAPDNGIKFFDGAGSKLDDAREAVIAARFASEAPWPKVVGDRIGGQEAMADAVGRYVAGIAGVVRQDLSGHSVVLDCANGAAFEAGPALYRSLGLEVEPLNIEPDGSNINGPGGAVAPEVLAAKASGRIGFAFDGDADRCIAVDEDGLVCNGDVVIAVLAEHALRRGELPGNRVVTTVMANLGFRLAMQRVGVEVTETPVGDRYVLEEMHRSGSALGGEQSGHVIFGDHGTGDGLLTGLRLLEVVVETGTPLKELRAVMTEYPQVLLNVPVASRGRLSEAKGVWAAVEDAEQSLGDDGRVLVRESGTEPLVRVMVEAIDPETAESVAHRLAVVVEQELG